MNLMVFKIVILLCLHHAYCIGFSRHKFYEKQNMNILRSQMNVTERWIEQPLDHFDHYEKRTWNMMYYECKDYWKPNGPIIIWINGEAELNSGAVYVVTKMSRETSAAAFSTEHRYYGQTPPIPLENTTKNYKYLTSKQALADVATLVKFLKQTQEYKTSKVIVHGGSYAGNLAAWMRLFYPELIDAAVSESAPVLAKVNFYEFAEKSTDDIKKYCSQDDYDNIRKKINRYEELLKTDSGINLFKYDTDMKKTENQNYFFSYAVGEYFMDAQYGPPSELIHLCNTSVLKLLKNEEYELKINKIIPYDKFKCENYDFDSYINILKSQPLRFWIYQTCNEFGYFATTSTEHQIFGKTLPIEFYYKTCTALFGPEFNEERVKDGVEATNKLYGGLKPNVTKVVFINGDMDPWSKLGILKDLSPDAPAIVVPNAGHCPYATGVDENVEQQVINIIKKWIGL